MGSTSIDEIDDEPQRLKKDDGLEKAQGEEEREDKEKKRQREEPKFELQSVKTVNGCHFFLPTSLDGKEREEEDKREKVENEKKKEEKESKNKGKEKEKEEAEFFFAVPGMAVVVPSPGHPLFYGIYRQKLRDARNEIERRKRKVPPQTKEGQTSKKQHMADDTSPDPSTSQQDSNSKDNVVEHCMCSSKCMTCRCPCVARSQACSALCHKKNTKCANTGYYISFCKQREDN